MKEIKGEFVKRGNTEYYKISNVNLVSPFLSTLSSGSDIWFFFTSVGGVTAGRKDRTLTILPYATEDKLCREDKTGPVTLISYNDGGVRRLWHPFTLEPVQDANIERNLYKSKYGDEVIFEEKNLDRNITFSYSYRLSATHGIVRTSRVETDEAISVLDGYRGILPYGISVNSQDNFTCLADAYKVNEKISKDTAVYSLSSAMNDSAEAKESLYCNIAKLFADFDCKLSLDEASVDAFVKGEGICDSDAVYGERGAFIIGFDMEKGAREWQSVIDTKLGEDEAEIFADTLDRETLNAELETERDFVRSIIGRADGVQCTNEKMSCVHHASNVNFNNMRGGLFLNNYDIDVKDFIAYANSCDKPMIEKNLAFFDMIKDVKTSVELKEKAKEYANPDILRIATEYLPISFSRRHGDPSRPWNKFSIVLKNADGTPRTNYEGNWRDIFQNWEAMSMSFPAYIEGMVSRFLNCTTRDGYNPYRISRDGIDWDVRNPNDEFSSIGYWGDHQIVYLSRLLESLTRYNKEAIDNMMSNDNYVFADVPYMIKDFDSIVKDPKHTIRFNHEKNKTLRENSAKLGQDYSMLRIDGELYHTSFVEKLLIPAMAKLSNLIIGGGIWMNTERPEWNDANNAIVGYGISVVTACYLLRHVRLLQKVLSEAKCDKCNTDSIFYDWFKTSFDAMKRHEDKLKDADGAEVYSFAEDMGKACDAYKTAIYKEEKGDSRILSFDEIDAFLKLAEKYLKDTVDKNVKEDGTVQSYNLLKGGAGCFEVEYMYPMLEGQVAYIGGALEDADSCADIIDKMEKSPLYSQRDKSFFLYPIRMTEGFLVKNKIDAKDAEKSSLIMHLINDNDRTFIIKTARGDYRFAPSIPCWEEFNNAFDKIKAKYPEAEGEQAYMEELYEKAFSHRSFTGRSQRMYKYEGVGCVYWHQNSKLLVAVSERMAQAAKAGEDLTKIRDAYERVRAGLGFSKTPAEWGGLPTDAYSHTPYRGGAKQPGMTGQVKEEIIARFTELGLLIDNSEISFVKTLVRDSEYLTEQTDFEFFSLKGKNEKITLDKGMLGYTFCQTPVIYQKSEKSGVTVTYENDETFIDSYTLPKDISREIFNRTGKIIKITVNV